MEDDMPPQEATSSWHLDKRVSMSVIIVLFIQTFSSAWWASRISADIDHMKSTIEIVMKDRYTSNDAVRDMKLIDQQFKMLNKWVDDHDDDHDDDRTRLSKRVK